MGQLLLGLAMLLCLVCAAITPSAWAAGSYTYLFETTTGATNGSERKIQFFIINYTDEENAEHSQFLFPFEDTFSEGYREAAAGSTEQSERDQVIQDSYGYTLSSLTDRKALQAYKTDQYLFSLPVGIRTVNQIQVFARENGSWVCQAARLYRVERLGGLYRYNDTSPDVYIDFEGTIISQVNFASSSAHTISWDADRLSNLGGQDSLNGVSLSVPSGAAATKSLQHDKDERTLAMLIHFADVYGAGLETLSTLPSDSEKTLPSLGRYETGAWSIRYLDRYGAVRETSVPITLNAVEWALARDVDSNTALAGIAQQGEELCMAVFLPDFAAFYESSLTVGKSVGESLMEISENGFADLRATHNDAESNVAGSENNVAAFADMSIWDLSKTELSAAVNEDSKTIRWSATGNPIAYQVAENASGEPLRANTTSRLTLKDYPTNGTKPSPYFRDQTERYLLTLTTDDVAGAGTTGDLYVNVAYVDLQGNNKQTDNLNARDYCQDYYGIWPGMQNQNGYYGGVARGQSLQVLIPIKDVKSITKVTVQLDNRSADTWQMKDMTVSAVKSMGKREIAWSNYGVNGYISDRRISRTMDTIQLFSYSDIDGIPILYQQGDTNDIMAGASVDVVIPRSIDWSEIRYSMDYEQASQDFGFLKGRYTYTVDVVVGDALVTSAENGDCGSRNLFYFRLVFKNGASGYVLANQQLSSDGFRAGREETFKISTNQDYGDVTAVQIIPDNSTDNENIYDKLNIKQIKIKKDSNTALVPEWTIHEVGWIGIDYRDTAESQSITGAKARSAEELTHVYTVDGSTYSANLLVSITTADYERPDEQFRGAISAVVYYGRTTPSTEPYTVDDVVRSMYDYMKRTPVYSDAVGGMAVSDPAWMFRPGHTDRFLISLSDVASINRIEFFIRSTSGVKWNISNISISQVNGEGRLIINKDNEYQQIYAAGQEPTPLTKCNSETVPAYEVNPVVYNGSPTPLYVNFLANRVELSPDAKQWSSVLTEVPSSQNDTINVFVYPSVSDTNTPPTEYDMYAAAFYKDVWGEPGEASSDVMRTASYNGQPVFYATDLTATAMDIMTSLQVKAQSRQLDQVGMVVNIQKAVVQQVRSGVIINTWEYSGGLGGAEWGAELTPVNSTTRRQQTVMLQLGEDVPETVLETGQNDIAVALRFRTSDPGAQEFRSPYVYLGNTVSTIHAGQVVELNFKQPGLEELVGISVASLGSVTGSVSSAYVIDRQVNTATGKSLKTEGEYSVSTPMVLSAVPYSMPVSGHVRPVEMTFTTGEANQSEGGGTDGPVRMTLGYYDRYGDLRTFSTTDLRQYLVDEERRFSTNSVRTARFLVDDLTELRWVELAPWHESGARNADWTLSKLQVSSDSVAADPTVDQIIREGEPLRIVLASLSLKLNASTTMNGATTSVETAGGEVSILTAAKGTVTIRPTPVGTEQGWNVTANRIVDGFPANAEDTVTRTATTAVFTAPDNKTGSTATYQLTFSLEEAPSVKSTVLIGVESDPVPTPTPAVTQTESGTTGGGSAGGSSGSGGAPDAPPASGSTAGEGAEDANAPSPGGGAAESGGSAAGEAGPAGGSDGQASGGESTGSAGVGSDSDAPDTNGSGGDGSGDDGSGDDGSGDDGAGDDPGPAGEEG